MSINVLTIDDFYLYGSDDDIFILDEYDMMVDDYPYGINNSQLNGIWQFKGRKVCAFSATSSMAYERLINNCIVKP